MKKIINSIKGFITIFRPKKSLKRYLAICAGNIAIWSPFILIYKKGITGQDFLDYWQIMTPILLSYYMLGKYTDTLLPQNKLVEINAVKFSGSVSP